VLLRDRRFAGFSTLAALLRLSVAASHRRFPPISDFQLTITIRHANGYTAVAVPRLGCLKKIRIRFFTLMPAASPERFPACSHPRDHYRPKAFAGIPFPEMTVVILQRSVIQYQNYRRSGPLSSLHPRKRPNPAVTTPRRWIRDDARASGGFGSSIRGLAAGRRRNFDAVSSSQPRRTGNQESPAIPPRNISPQNIPPRGDPR
jgi:hypothetical protein